MEIDAAVRHDADGGCEFVGTEDPLPRVEDDRNCLHEIELVPRPGPRDHERLTETFIDDIQRYLAKLFHGRKDIGINHPETFGHDLVAEPPPCPDREVIPV